MRVIELSRDLIDPSAILPLSVSHSMPASEYQALKDLYHSTGGDEWSWKDYDGAIAWNFTGGADPCGDNWQGIDCDDDKKHVTRLVLTGMGLVGRLPDSIGDLPWLVHLILNCNILTGRVPDTMMDLTSLEILNMNQNMLEGELPDFSNLTELLMFDFGVNQLSGRRPAYLHRFTKLLYLDLSNNEFDGPSSELINTLATLQYRDFSSITFPGLFATSTPDMASFHNRAVLPDYLFRMFKQLLLGNEKREQGSE